MMMTSKFKSVCVGVLCASVLSSVGCSEAIIEGSAPGTDDSTTSQSLRVAGPWAPPASTISIAQTQYVPVVNPPSVAPLGSCSSSNPFQCSCQHPACTPAQTGTKQLDTYLRNRWQFLGYGGLFCCRQNSARTSVPKLSVHAVGRAIDLMVPLDGGDADNGAGDQVANWLVENAEFIGIQRVIWDKKYWNGERGFGNLSSNSSPHVDHIHVELSIDGAAGRTAFFTTGAVNGTCTPKCQGNLLVKQDCSTQDCTVQGSQCLSGPPVKCSDPPPPEPPETTRASGITPPTVTLQGTPSRVTFAGPKRLFDTREQGMSGGLTRFGGGSSGPLLPGGANTLQDTSVLGAGVKGAWLNIASIVAPGPGFVAVTGAGEPQPETSSLNYAPMSVTANLAPVMLGRGGGIDFYTAPGETNLVADVTATLTPTGQGMTSMGPSRVLDTRSFNGALEPEKVQEVDLRLPPGTTGVAATFAIVQPEERGFLKVWACGTPEPETSNINYAAQSVKANTIISGIGADGKLCMKSLSKTHLVVDVSGYFSEDGPLSFQALEPVRVFDTRSEESIFQDRMAQKQVIEVPVQQLGNMPDAVWSVVTNITVVGADGPGFITAYPCGGGIPGTSSLNYDAEGAHSSLSIAPVGANGKLCLFSSTRTHLIVDMVGVWIHDESSMPTMMDMQNDPNDDGDQLDPDDPNIMRDMGMTSTPDMGAAVDMSTGNPPVLADMSGPTTPDMSEPGGNQVHVKGEGRCQVVSLSPESRGELPWLGLVVIGGLGAWRRRRRDR